MPGAALLYSAEASKFPAFLVVVGWLGLAAAAALLVYITPVV